MRIDSHQHFWKLEARSGRWPPPSLGAIHRDFLPPDLAPDLERSCVDGTVVVQSLQEVADTRFLLALADRHAFILGVVGWADLKAGDAAETIRELARHRLLKGLRPMLQDLDDPSWIDDPALDPAIRAMEALGLCFDALVRREHLPSLLRFARRHPALPIVVDHAAKPDIAAGDLAGWRDRLAEMAALPGVHVKLSGLLTEADRQAGPDAIAPYVAEVLSLFGTGRVMWGSDWPVLRLAGEYGAWLSLCEALVPADAHDAVFARNACRFYRLESTGRAASKESS